MGFCLVPICCAAVVVASLVCVSVFYGDFYGFVEVDGVEDVVAVPGNFAVPVLVIAWQGEAVVGCAVLLGRAPAHTVEVLRPCAYEARQLLAVDEDHVVALTVPVESLGWTEVVHV